MTGRRPQRAPLEEKHALNPVQLALHYGEEFPDWASDFLQNLSEPGISILRGDAGTGKTSFIRHAMCALAKTHRFYFVPVDNFSLLSSGSLTEFWKSEQRGFPSASKVLVLEDSETLLSERGHEKNSPVAALLNLTDGLMTQFVRLHLICTLNCKMEDVDPALLRPGRLRFFKNFEHIPRDRAIRIAKHYDLKLSEKADFTLAEIFASPKFHKNTSGAYKEKGPIGFSG
jgi:SpoVK/Ycf46/Vps4 family AAA+-type ATPase